MTGQKKHKSHNILLHVAYLGEIIYGSFVLKFILRYLFSAEWKWNCSVKNYCSSPSNPNRASLSVNDIYWVNNICTLLNDVKSRWSVLKGRKLQSFVISTFSKPLFGKGDREEGYHSPLWLATARSSFQKRLRWQFFSIEAAIPLQSNTVLHFVMFLPLIDISKEVMVSKIDYSLISHHH